MQGRRGLRLCLGKEGAPRLWRWLCPALALELEPSHGSWHDSNLPIPNTIRAAWVAVFKLCWEAQAKISVKAEKPRGKSQVPAALMLLKGYK